jgi:ATP-dependent helicase HrpA
VEKKWVIPREVLGNSALFGSHKGMLWEIVSLALARVFLDCAPEEIETEALFLQRLAAGRGMLTKAIEETHALVCGIVVQQRALLLRLQAGDGASWRPVAEEMRAHLDGLIYPGFLRQTPGIWLKQFPRYLRGVALRLERRGFAPLKDAQKAAEFSQLWRQYQAVLKKQEEARIWDPELRQYRWLLEEYRVSLFAQDLRTVVPVSAKRLAEQWEKVLR